MKASVVQNHFGAWRWAAALVAVALVLATAACGPAAPVVQGKVVGIDGKTVSVVDETTPDAAPIALDVSSAEIGNLPEVGDVIRAVYQVDGQTNRALAVMNVTRQEQNEGKAP